jgi:hypothetical protein
MKKVLTTKEGIILAIGDDLTPMTDEEGVTWIDGRGFKIYGQKLFDVENIPEDVTPHIYTYDGVIFMQYESAIDRIRNEAIDEYTLHLIEEGHI